MGHDGDEVGAFIFGLIVALGHTAKVFAECCLSYFLGDGVFYEFAILGGGLDGGCIDDRGAEVFDVHIEIAGAKFGWG
mgnify:CR=1 FL=1